jgi:hypothetical protein
MLLVAAILLVWAAAALFAVGLCHAARRGDRVLSMARPRLMDVDVHTAQRFERVS